MRGHALASVLLAGATFATACTTPALAQGLDMSQGGQVSITAAGGFDWDQNTQTVTAYDRAQAVRGNVTVRADRLIAYYRKKTPGAHTAQAPKPAPISATAPGHVSGNASGNASGASPAAISAASPQSSPPITQQADPSSSAVQDPATDAPPPDASIRATHPADRAHPTSPGKAPAPAQPRQTTAVSAAPPVNSPSAVPTPATQPGGAPVTTPPAVTPATSGTPKAAGGDPDVDTSLVTHSDTLPEDLPPPDRPASHAMGHDNGPAPGDSSPGNGGSEVYRLEAVGHVHIFTNTDQAWGDRAVYDMDQAVLVMTGKNMKMTTPQDILTARDTVEYHSRDHMSVSRGDATLTTNDGRQMRADILVGYDRPKTARPPHTQAGHDAGGAGAIDRVDAFGHILIRTQSEAVTGDRGVYVPDSAIARIVGNVHISRGLNQISGAAAIVNMRTGIATLTDTPGSRVSGLVVPNQAGTGNKGTTK